VFELHHLSAQEQYDWLRRGQVSPRELTDHYLARIERIDPGLGAFATVTADGARDRADALGAAGRTAAPLWGLPLADKDLTDRAGVPTGAGSRLSRGRIPAVSSGIVRAVDTAGAVSLGKTPTPEFGLTSYTETLVGPPTRNPYDLALGPGARAAERRRPSRPASSRSHPGRTAADRSGSRPPPPASSA
jgi:amidase